MVRKAKRPRQKWFKDVSGATSIYVRVADETFHGKRVIEMTGWKMYIDDARLLATQLNECADYLDQHGATR